ncbi:hypothetical protein D1007_06544 [Hordeum vulgare]|nr:hypothetical protein D1007_06544 [Hordeum vulgare]
MSTNQPTATLLPPVTTTPSALSGPIASAAGMPSGSAPFAFTPEEMTAVLRELRQAVAGIRTFLSGPYAPQAAAASLFRLHHGAIAFAILPCRSTLPWVTSRRLGGVLGPRGAHPPGPVSPVAIPVAGLARWVPRAGLHDGLRPATLVAARAVAPGHAVRRPLQCHRPIRWRGQTPPGPLTRFPGRHPPQWHVLPRPLWHPTSRPWRAYSVGSHRPSNSSAVVRGCATTVTSPTFWAMSARDSSTRRLQTTLRWPPPLPGSATWPLHFMRRSPGGPLR